MHRPALEKLLQRSSAASAPVNWPRRAAQSALSACAIALLNLLVAATMAQAATFTVSKTADTNDGVCNADCSLREAITAANGNGVADTIAFNIPLTDPGYNAGTGVFTISIATLLPGITGATTTIDATTQTANVGNTNPAVFGTGGTVGVGADGIVSTGDEPALPMVAGPEIELRDGAALAVGLWIQSNNATIRGLAILGFGAANGDGAIRIDNNFTGTLIEQNVLGTTAASFSDPGAALRNHTGIHSESGDSGTIRNNLIGYQGTRGIWLTNGSAGWVVQGNEVRDSGLNTTDGDGIAIDGSGPNSITANLIVGSSSQGFIVTAAGSNNNTFVNNTVTGNGVGTTTSVLQSAGITLRASAGPTVFNSNWIHANYGAGIQVNNAATGIRLTANAFADNGTIVARDGSPATGQIGVDLNGPGDDANFGTAPYYSVNDSGDGDSGGNNRINFPIIETAAINGGNLTLAGWALPGSLIQFYIADGDPSGFGEGEVFLTALVEGSVADTDGTSGPYGPGPINGLAQGSDNTNRYRFTLATPAGVGVGTSLTAIATLVTNTSEFSGIAPVTSSISGRVFEDVAGDVLNDGPIGAAANPGYVGTTVALFRDDGDNVPEATDLSVGSTVTAAGGSYTFSGLTAGVYWVVVDSTTLYSNQDVGAAVTDIWAEQTYGSIGAWCADGGGGTSERLTAGTCYGGSLGNRSDDAVAPDSAEHIARVVLASGEISDIDFGFSFNTVTTIRGADGSDDDPPATNGRTVQGSLLQFTQNANTIAGANAMRFVPAEPTNASAGANSWWRITVTSPQTLTGYDTFVHFSDADATLDGRAFDLTDGLTIRNTNTAAIGANETVGVAGIYTTPTLDPELEIFNDAAVFAIDRGIDIQADRISIRHIAIYGFGVDVIEADIIVGDNGAPIFIDSVVIEDNVVGSGPAATVDPGATGSRRRGIFISRTTNGILRRNIIRFTDENGVSLALYSTGWLVAENEISSAGGPGYYGFVLTNSQTDFNGNLVAAAGNDGLLVSTDCVLAADNNTLRDNGDDGFTIIANSTAVMTNNIVRNNTDIGLLLTTSGNTLTANRIQNNADAGIQVRAVAINNSLSQNLFGGNGGIAIDLVDAAISKGITANTTTPPACGYDAGVLGNDGLDFPEITMATTTAVSGVACPGSQVEIYRAVADPDFSDNTDPVGGTGDNHGEGIAYLGFATAAAGTGLFSLAGISGLTVGDEVSVIAIDGSGNTSEFARSVKAGLIIQKLAFWLDGTPIGDGATIPKDIEFKFMLYINNLGPATTDVSLRDVLDPLFSYQPGTIQVDNTVAACALQDCAPAEESAIFASARSAPFLTDAVDGDIASFGAATVNAGDQNVANGQLDIAAGSVLAVVFSARLQ